MRRPVRSLVVITFVISCVVAFGWSSPLAALVQLLGTTALVMGGTQHPLVDPSLRLPDVFGSGSYGFSETGLSDSQGRPAGYVAAALTKYVAPAGLPDEPDNVMAVWTPEEFWPTYGSQKFDASVRTGVANLDRCVHGEACIAHVYPDGQSGPADTFTVFAYSQSARIASLEKGKLIEEFRAGEGETSQQVTFVMIGNPNRGNGGILQRFDGLYIPILDVTFDGASPTDGPVVDGEYLYPTVDVVRQYDGWGDFPVYALNLLADVNAVAGIVYLHGDYFVGTDVNPVAGQPYLYQAQVGDTNYYMLATKRLPVLLPLASIGVPDPILTALDAPLRVLVEMGYEREVSPGTPTTIKLVRLADPGADLLHLAVATVTGLDDGLAEAANDPDFRPFRTEPAVSTFGVGGPVLPETAEPVAPTGPAVESPAPGDCIEHETHTQRFNLFDRRSESEAAAAVRGAQVPAPATDEQKSEVGEPKHWPRALRVHARGERAISLTTGPASEPGGEPDSPKSADAGAAPGKVKRGPRFDGDRQTAAADADDSRNLGHALLKRQSDSGSTAPKLTGPRHRAVSDRDSGGRRSRSAASSADGAGAEG